jgi:threonine dehydratase
MLSELEEAARLVYESLPPTPQIRWPLLEQALGRTLWVKHENVNATGAFKVRGGIFYVERRLREHRPTRLFSATRGNHGQSLGLAARRAGVPLTVIVPHGNSREKNAAMRVLGVELIEHGQDFQEAREHSEALAAREGGLHVPPFHRDLVCGVATYALELLRAVPDLARVYVPVGMGSGICGLIAAKRALAHSVEIVGVVSTLAPAYLVAFETGAIEPRPVTTLLADGMACRLPDAQALAFMREGASRLIAVTDEEIAAAMRAIFEAMHHVAEGAGAAAYAAALQDRDAGRLPAPGASVAVVLSGGNVDRDVYARVLAG